MSDHPLPAGGTPPAWRAECPEQGQAAWVRFERGLMCWALDEPTAGIFTTMDIGKPDAVRLALAILADAAAEGVTPQAEDPPGAKPAYRLLVRGEVIQRGDEQLGDDAETWSPVQPIAVRMPYNPAVLVPVRRLVQEPAAAK